ncbi:DUF2971 domain-containing protein [Sphingomonas asaccharolytica]|uniref:DUF2971 domain-containing protein n=1 Tax=Sphingomonas asaccharolytica TaxID=40681 RepID=UPI0009FBC7D3|nr:DUF2971 domain-containing protein [Sphingomonas asaccharolytica]
MSSFKPLRPKYAKGQSSLGFTVRERGLPFHRARMTYSSAGNLRDQTQRAVASICYTMSSEFSIPDNLIYHYTDYQAFASMMSTGELWASHHTSMNDFKEIDHAWDVLAIQTSNLLHRKEYVGDIFCEVEKIFKEDVNIFICSFTREENALSQWRAYAGPDGVAISFSEDLFSYSALEPTYDLGAVVYDEQEKAELALPIAKKLAAAFNEGKSREQIEGVARGLKSDFARVAPFMKSSGFSEEEEVRLVSYGHGHEIFERKGKFGTVKFIKISFDQAFKCVESLDFSIVNILSGPALDQDRSVKRVNDVMSQYCRKFNVIYNCGIPYRTS